MPNTTLHKTLIDRYNALAFTHNYIFGFADNGNIIASVTTSEVLPFVTCLDASSRNGGASLRFKPNRAQKELLKQGSTFVVCSEDYFEELTASTKYNRGEIFEMLVTERFGQKWTKDHVPFTEAGDIEVCGTPYQIKFSKATFTNEATLRALSK